MSSDLVREAVPHRLVGDAPVPRMARLGEKLARHLTLESWQRLFHRPAIGTISFERKRQTVLYAEPCGAIPMDALDRDSFAADLEWLAARHHGRVDHFSDGAGVVHFDDPAACVRMALDLQRRAAGLRLRMGVYTAVCDIATFRGERDWHSTLVGSEARVAARVSATAAIGSIAISPATYALVKQEIDTDAGGCLLMEEFHDSDLAQISLTPAPIKHSEHAMSTFAGLGY